MITVTELVVHKATKSPIYGDDRIILRVDDEAAGSFLVIEQNSEEVRIDWDELEDLVEAAKRLRDGYPEDLE